MSRGQSHVVGVALMLGLTVLALGLLTAGVGTVFDAQTATADAQRVADGLEASLQPLEQTGPATGRLAFGDGRLTTAPRQLRIFRNGSLAAEEDVGAVIFTADDRRVAFLAGGIVRGQDAGAWLSRDPSVAASRDGGVIVVSAPALNASHQTVAGGGEATLVTNVSHDRATLGRGTYDVAIETETPAAFERYFEREGVPTERRDVDGDGIPSVVARYPGARRGYLVVHDMRLEVQ
jgi:hypothetical protein